MCVLFKLDDIYAIYESEETQEALRDATGKCINGQLTTFTLQTTAYGLTNNGT